MVVGYEPTEKERLSIKIANGGRLSLTEAYKAHKLGLIKDSILENVLFQYKIIERVTCKKIY